MDCGVGITNSRIWKMKVQANSRYQDQADPKTPNDPHRQAPIPRKLSSADGRSASSLGGRVCEEARQTERIRPIQRRKKTT